MILVDTSVWVEHLRAGHARLQSLLHEDAVLCHPFVVGELACGQIRNRGEVLSLLERLPRVRTLDHDEALGFIERHRLMGRGLGWVDVHLLGAALLSRAALWTLDRRLAEAAARVGAAASIH